LRRVQWSWQLLWSVHVPFPAKSGRPGLPLIPAQSFVLVIFFISSTHAWVGGAGCNNLICLHLCCCVPLHQPILTPYSKCRRWIFPRELVPLPPTLRPRQVIASEFSPDSFPFCTFHLIQWTPSVVNSFRPSRAIFTA